MLNYIWAVMLIIGFFIATLNGQLTEAVKVSIESADSAIKLAIAFLGVMCMWSGLMNIAEKSGLINYISIVIRPVLKILFPDIPSKHPALGAIVMNIVANMMGLGNAATPLGVKAMNELQKINKKKDTASNAMCMLLVINAASVQLIPTTVIALRSAEGASNPMDVIGPVWITSICALTTGIITAKILEKFF